MGKIEIKGFEEAGPLGSDLHLPMGENQKESISQSVVSNHIDGDQPVNNKIYNTYASALAISPLVGFVVHVITYQFAGVFAAIAAYIIVTRFICYKDFMYMYGLIDFSDKTRKKFTFFALLGVPFYLIFRAKKLKYMKLPLVITWLLVIVLGLNMFS